MEEADDGKSTDNNSKNSSMTAIVMKGLELARNVKVVVTIFVVVVSCCLVLYFSSYSNDYNFGQLLSFSSSFYSLSATPPGPPANHEPVHDEYYELRNALKAAATEDKTVILTTLNDAWAEPNNIFDIFLESFRIGNDIARLLNHLLVIAVDDKAYSRCQALVSHCYFFKSNHSTEMAHEAKFMTPIYLEMMWERLDFLRIILTLGYNFVFTDTDIMWFRNPFPHFYPNIDFQTSCDSFNGNPTDLNNAPNNGFNFIRSNSRTIKFYTFWVSSRRKYPSLHEQNVFNKIKHSSYVKKIGVSFRFLDTDYFGGLCTPSKDFNKVCTMHANCCKGLDKKIADLNAVLEDWKMYVNVSSTTNQTIETHWRAPDRCRKWD